MHKISTGVDFFFKIAKFQTELYRRLDSRLGGISFNELIILHHLSQAPENKMRRIDLAEKIGLTASGVTRLLLPMEKIGLVKKESNEHDARVSLVVLATGGQTKLTEGLERAEIFCEDTITADMLKDIEKLSQTLVELGKNI